MNVSVTNRPTYSMSVPQQEEYACAPQPGAAFLMLSAERGIPFVTFHTRPKE